MAGELNGSERLITSSDEQTRMNDCYFEKKDWRACKAEVCVQCCWLRSGFSPVVLDGSFSRMLETQGKRCQDGEQR